MHAGFSSVQQEQLKMLVQQEVLPLKMLVQQEVLPRLQSEYGVQRSSVFGQQPVGVTATIHGAFALPHALRRA